MINLLRTLIFVGLMCMTSMASAETQSYSKVKIRAITGFVRIEPANYTDRIAETLTVLRAAKSEFEKEGYEVQTIRIVTQPLGELVSGQSDSEALAFLKALDDLSVKENFVPGVGPAMLRDSDDPRTIRLLARALTTLPNIQGTAILADEDGIHWQVIKESAALVHHVAAHQQSSRGGNLNFTGVAMIKPYGPFFPGSYHMGPGQKFSVGLEGANVVQDVFARTHGDFDRSVAELTSQLALHAKAVESVSEKVALKTGWEYMGVDASPAPLGDVSIGAAIETYTGARFGSSGSMTAALIVTTALKAVSVKKAGYNGLMLPVMEDKRIAQRWAEGAVDMDSLLAYSAVCGTGLDTIPLPGDVSEEQLARIMGDVASLAWKWNKPLSARLQPVRGKKAGDQTTFTDRYLFNTTLQPLP